jgi:crotonobetainyl-CoA:carnitine CoA-transferase CaiB-like acyl-CoA transferase
MTDRLPLAGYRVLELAHLVAGPVCGMCLADMGADVIKVEAPDGGDALRKTYRALEGRDSPAFLVLNRNKRSLALDLSRPPGLEAFRRLAAGADVVIEAYRGGVAERLGIDAASLATVNPRLVYCSLSAFGPGGPWRTKPGVDMLVQAMSGLMAITGEPGGGPVLIGAPLIDTIGGLLASQGILTALLHRATGGEGQRVDVSLLEGALLAQAARLPLFWASGEDPGRHGSAHAHLAPFQAFEASDGWIYVAVWVDRMWKPFCQVMGLEDMADDPALGTRESRRQHRDRLVARLEPLFRTRTVADWMARLEAADVLCAPVNTYADLDADPQIGATGIFQEQEHPGAGRVRTLGTPVRFEKTPGTLRRPAPALGEHSTEVLREAGLDPAEVDRLHQSGVIR